MGPVVKSIRQKLGVFSSTAIAGNDILSSCLYVCGIAIVFAGIYAPLVFLGIVLVLYLYKHVYVEVVEALPLNGGAYNCLLNATSKSFAAVAGVMTVLSYVATSVISAKTATEYVHTIFTSLPVLPITAGIIITFCLLTLLGLKDSAKIAKIIFVFHLFCLGLFICMGIIQIVNNGGGFLMQNWASTDLLFANQGAGLLLFFAFSASLLGVSGFESSANFVEEQERGVFRKTLSLMTLGVLLLNPLITVVILRNMNLASIGLAKDFVLSESAAIVGGQALKSLIVVDAFLVLSGAVLASFIGATGLLYRMTLDHCLPSSILLPKLRRRNSGQQRIILLFTALCLSILFVTQGALLTLAGVYTISFLGVMTAFAIGNMVLRKNRPDLKRTYQSSIIFVILAALATIAGIVGNIRIDPNNLLYFLLYFLPAITIVLGMVYRDYILEYFLKLSSPIRPLHRFIKPYFEHVVNPRIIYFAHDPQKLFWGLRYIQRNETSRNITIVFCQNGERKSSQFIEHFKKYIEVFQDAKIFENIHFEFLVEADLDFGPDVVKAYANRFKIGRNNIFIGSIHESHEFSFEDLGGVRIIQ
ncbi:MAG TPA: APC family permease [Candidatus Saccharimonadia bacterium]|nr:APC family permease [Candidatus Saccharimonadia bacterium]